MKSNNWNIRRMEYANDTTLGKRHNFVMPLIIIALVILASLFFAVKAFAMSDNRANGCHTYNVNSIYGGVDNQEAIFCGNGKDTSKNHGDNNPSVTTSATVTVEDNTPSTTNDDTSTVKHENKPKCNNGEGNGSEGCSPAKSINANDDENQTSPHDDKNHKG